MTEYFYKQRQRQISPSLNPDIPGMINHLKAPIPA